MQEEIQQAEERQMLREHARIAAETRKLTEEAGNPPPDMAPWEREFLAEDTPERQATDEEILCNRWTVVDGMKVFSRALEWVESLMRQYRIAKQESPRLEAMPAPDPDAWPLAPRMDVTGIKAKGSHSDPTVKRAAQLAEVQRRHEERQAKIRELRNLIARVDMELALLQPAHREMLVHAVIARRSDPEYKDAEAVGKRLGYGRKGSETLRNLALLEVAMMMLPRREWDAGAGHRR